MTEPVTAREMIEAFAFPIALFVAVACSPAATDTAVRSAEHNADLTVCRQRGMAAPKPQQWDVYSKCADEADAKDKAKK